MMTSISAGQAWDETKAFLTRERRLFVPVVLALVTLPLTALRMTSPEMFDLKAVVEGRAATGSIALLYAVLFIQMVALLALIRLALGRSEAVGATIVSVIPRTLIMLVSFALLCIAFAVLFTIAMIPFAIGQAPVAPGAIPPGMMVFMLVAVAIMLLMFIRLMLIIPASAAEKIGPLALIKRGWRLGKGNGLRLIATMLLVFLASIILNAALVTIVGLFAKWVLGSVSGMTVGGLLVSLAAGLLSALVVSVQAGLLASLYSQAAGPDR